VTKKVVSVFVRFRAASIWGTGKTPICVRNKENKTIVKMKRKEV
jgi:hypothetical protein